jgi:hypothetical protein
MFSSDFFHLDEVGTIQDLKDFPRYRKRYQIPRYRNNNLVWIRDTVQVTDLVLF